MSPEVQPGSARAAPLAAWLREAGAALVAVVERIEPEPWARVPKPGVWSVGKEAEHAAEGVALHAWVVRLSVGERVPSAHPAVERKQLTSALSPREAAELIRRRIEEAARLVQGLSDTQLDLPKRPAGTRPRTLAEEIEGTLIGHLDHHRAAIEAKLRAATEEGARWVGQRPGPGGFLARVRDARRRAARVEAALAEDDPAPADGSGGVEQERDRPAAGS